MLFNEKKGGDMKANLGQIETLTMQTQVYLRLREALFTGHFLPGESLTIRNLAETLGVSPMPVREALQRLVAERALVQMPNRTFRVSPFTPEMFRELMRVRISVEGLAADQAARNMTAESLERLREINQDMIRGVEINDATMIMNANREFHFKLYDAAGMPQLMDIINGVWLRAGPYLMNAHRKLAEPLPFYRAGTSFHERFLAAAEKHEPKAAARAIACDIWHSARHFRLNMELVNAAEQTAKTRAKRASKQTEENGKLP